MLPSLDEKLVGVEALRIFLLLNELLHVIQRNKQRQSTELAVMVAAAIRRLSEESLHVIGRQLCGLFIFVINRPQLISPSLRQRRGNVREGLDPTIPVMSCLFWSSGLTLKCMYLHDVLLRGLVVLPVALHHG